MLKFLLAACCLCAVYGANPPACGVPVVQPNTPGLAGRKRIVGGQVAVPGSWPMTVMIVDNYGFISGSGTIINAHVILTSAQHFEGPGFSVFDLSLNNWRLYAGAHNVSTADPHEHFYHIHRVILHPGYNISSLENDIALVITEEAIVWNEHTRPACLPDATHMYTVGQHCYLPGWGRTSSTGNEESLNQLMYPILGDSICSNHWVDFLPDNEICAGYENSTKDFCNDDIGSPLLCKDFNGAWFVQGIASSGGDCSKGDEPGVFEDVHMYTAWIKKSMEDANYPYQY